MHPVLGLLLLTQAPADAKIVDLSDGFVRVEAPTYSVEVPKGWQVSSESPWGARSAKPKAGAGELGIMTAPPGQQTWDELYRTSLYFIQREKPGKATPYKLEKTDQGYDACTFSILDEAGFAERRYVLLKAASGRLLALSVKIPGPKSEKEMKSRFDRMVKTARIQ